MPIQITEKVVNVKGVNKTAVAVDWSVSSYSRNGSMLQIAWNWLDANNTVIDGDILTLGNDVVSIWGVSDAPIDDALLAFLEATAV